MTLNMTLYKRLSVITNAAQDSVTSHAKLCSKFMDIYKESDFDEFFHAFQTMTEALMINMAKNPYQDRLIEFIAKIATSLSVPVNNTIVAANKGDQTQTNETMQNSQATLMDEVENPLLVRFMNYLIEINRSNSDAVRYRCCQIMAKLMGLISNEQFIDEELFDRLSDALLERLKDINSRVQVQAVSAIYRLQDPNDRQCRIIKALLFLLTHDPHWQVRYQALSHIAFSKQTLPHIIDRVTDLHPNVRRKALLILSEKVLIKFISIEKRLFILNYSLKDQEPIVVETCCKKLLPSWLAFKENNIVKLLKALDVVESTELVELMLNKMYEDESLESLCRDFSLIGTDTHVISLENLDAESALYWRWLSEKCKNEKIEECLDLILPSLTEFCNYVKSVMQNYNKIEESEEFRNLDDVVAKRRKLENLFVIKQLIKMFEFLDFSDAHGKKSLISLSHELFSNRNCSYLFSTIMTIYKIAIPNLQTRINNIVELISDLRDPASALNASDDLEVTVVQSNDNMATTPGRLTTPANVTSTVKINSREHLVKMSELKFQKIKINDELDSLSKDVRSVSKNVDIGRIVELREELKRVEDEMARLEAQKKANERIELIPTNENDEQEQQPQQPQQQYLDPQAEFDNTFHCLELSIALLEDPELKTLAPQLRALCDNLIVPNLCSIDEELRALSVNALNLICILKVEMAEKYMPLFLEMIQHDKKDVVLEAFKALINIILAFSLNKLVKHETDDAEAEHNINESMKNIMAIMTGLLDNQDSDIYTTAATGFAKLFMTGHLTSAKLFSKLLIMYYSPLTETDKKLRAMLACFLPQFSFLRSSNQLCVEQSFMITIKCLMNAPVDSYLSQIDINKVTEILLHLTNPKNLLRKANQHQVSNNICHENIARNICDEILLEENTFKLRTYLKLLNQLDISEAEYYTLKDFKTLAEEIVEQISDRLLKKSAKKFEETVDALILKKPEYEIERQRLLTQDKTVQIVNTDKDVDDEDGLNDDSPQIISTNKNTSMDTSDIMDTDFRKINKKGKPVKKEVNTTQRVELKDCSVVLNRTDITQVSEGLRLRLSESTAVTERRSTRSRNSSLVANDKTITPTRGRELRSSKTPTTDSPSISRQRSATQINKPKVVQKKKAHTKQRAQSESTSSLSEYEPPKKRKSLRLENSKNSVSQSSKK